MRARCDCRKSTAEVSRPAGRPPLRDTFAIRPARACSSKNAADSTPMPLISSAKSGTSTGTNVFHAERLQRLERRRGVGLRRRLGQLVERRLQDADLQRAHVERRVPVERQVADAHVAAVGPGDRLHHERAVFGVAAERAQPILRPRQRHGAVPADAAEGRPQADHAAARRPDSGSSRSSRCRWRRRRRRPRWPTPVRPTSRSTPGSDPTGSSSGRRTSCRRRPVRRWRAWR